ncbi:MAG: AMP-binding protein [Phycisphaerae bacterium]|nr:AMP-binding protein [Phycisphaerae bacterium]
MHDVGENDLVNVAAYLPETARRQPDQRAIVWPVGRGAHDRVAYRHLTFLELDRETDRYAHGLERAGILRGTRTILMVRPSVEFFALVFALYKVGAVPVLIDPGMGTSRMVGCLRAVEAEAFVGIPLAHVLRVLHPGAFKSVRVCVTVGRRWCWGGLRLQDLRTDPWRPYEMATTREDEPAAIIFTTGSTGPPKGVLYLHGMFDAQVRILREHLNIRPGEVDLPTFPLFALFDPALGMTAVLPDMDPTRPASVDPVKIIGAIRDQGVTHMFGSPALLDRVGRYGEAHGVKLSSLKRVVSAGAPVPPATLERFGRMLEGEAEIHTPYGATEALPVASIGSGEILRETRDQSARGGGTCVGRPMPGVTVRVIKITDDPIDTWSDDLVLPTDEIGEIVVKGPVVTREYCTDAAATRLAKITDTREGRSAHPQSPIIHPQSYIIWHRMGDVGHFDEQGRLWFCGRKAHRVVTENGTLFTVPCEAIFNQHPRVFRSALVGIGEAPRQKPVMCTELEAGDDGTGKEQLTRELLDLARQNDLTQSIDTVLYHPAFPVDIRHNAKIFREKLARWATTELRGEARVGH